MLEVFILIQRAERGREIEDFREKKDLKKIRYFWPLSHSELDVFYSIKFFKMSIKCV